MNLKRRPYWILFILAILPLAVAGCEGFEDGCGSASESGPMDGEELGAVLEIFFGAEAEADKAITTGDEETGSIKLIFSEGEVTGVMMISWNQVNEDLWDVTLFIKLDDGTCSDEEEPSAPALWLADVCEPDDGFSGDGWMTWGSDTIGILYVSASQDGTYYPTEFLSSPFIMDEAHLNGLASWMGLDDWHDLWLKVDETGQEVHVGATVRDRDARMGLLCGE